MCSSCSCLLDASDAFSKNVLELDIILSLCTLLSSRGRRHNVVQAIVPWPDPEHSLEDKVVQEGASGDVARLVSELALADLVVCPRRVWTEVLNLANPRRPCRFKMQISPIGSSSGVNMQAT